MRQGAAMAGALFFLSSVVLVRRSDMPGFRSAEERELASKQGRRARGFACQEAATSRCGWSLSAKTTLKGGNTIMAKKAAKGGKKKGGKKR